MTITNRPSARFIDRKRTLAINLTPTRYLTPRTVNCVRVHRTELKCHQRTSHVLQATVLNDLARACDYFRTVSRFKNQPRMYNRMGPTLEIE